MNATALATGRVAPLPENDLGQLAVLVGQQAVGDLRASIDAFHAVIGLEPTPLDDSALMQYALLAADAAIRTRTVELRAAIAPSRPQRYCHECGRALIVESGVVCDRCEPVDEVTR